jgi:hypothetical protein
MTFTESLILAVVDKLLIAVIVAFVGYWVKGGLERIRRQEQARLARVKRLEQFRLVVATAGLPAYQALWSITEAVSLSAERDLTEDDRRRFSEELRSWYYEKGNAMFLSLRALDLFQKAKKLLDEGKPLQEVRQGMALNPPVRRSLVWP